MHEFSLKKSLTIFFCMIDILENAASIFWKAKAEHVKVREKI
jgi:hypothetical protein